MAVRGFKTKCEHISLQLRRELGIRKRAPLIARDLARHLGVLLWEPSEIRGLSENTLAVLTRRGSTVWSAVTISCGEVDAVIYNPVHSEARQSSDIMHELSHILLVHEPSQIMVSPDNPFMLRSYNERLEEEASWLAGCLLLPRDALVNIRTNGLSDDEACDSYVVSHQLLTYRMNVTGVNRQFQSVR